jgi:hypothetical protein
MQHYGMITRLIDWSESAAVAAYFATRGWRRSGRREQAAIWMLNPAAMNYVTAEVGYRMLTLQHPEARRYLPSADPTEQPDPVPEPPVALAPASPTNRVAVQRGVFTLHGSLQLGIEEFEHAETYLRKAVIPAEKLERFSEDVDLAGIQESMVGCVTNLV